MCKIRGRKLSVTRLMSKRWSARAFSDPTLYPFKFALNDSIDRFMKLLAATKLKLDKDNESFFTFLNAKCHGKHFIHHCPNSDEAKKTTLRLEYWAAEKSRLYQNKINSSIQTPKGTIFLFTVPLLAREIWYATYYSNKNKTPIFSLQTCLNAQIIILNS